MFTRREHHHEGCLFRAMSSPDKIALKNNNDNNGYFNIIKIALRNNNNNDGYF